MSNSYNSNSDLWTTSNSYSSYDESSCDIIYASPSGSTTPSTWIQDDSSINSGYGFVPLLCYSGISIDTIVRRDDNDIPRAAVKCNFPTEAGHLYEISMGSVSGLSILSEKLNPEDVPQHFVWINDISDSITGFGLEQLYKCGVTVYDLNGNLEFGPVYSPAVAPVTFDTTVEVDRSGYAYIGVNLSLPFTCPDQQSCKLNIKLYDIYQNYYCYDDQIAFIGDTCGVQHTIIADESDVPNEQNVGLVYAKLGPKNNAIYYPSSSSFTLRMLFETEGTGSEQWWNGEFSANIRVTVKDDETYWRYALCYIENDPRIQTFDHIYYDLLVVSSVTPHVYVAVKHTVLPVQVQVLTEECVWGGSCSCGLIVQAGRDVFMLDHCNGQHDTSLIYGDNVLEVWLFNNVYKIYLPHGMVVRATVSNPTWFWGFSFTMVNIHIYPTPFDMGKLDGLCGNFDGDRYDDYQHAYSDGVDGFIPLWDVTETSDSLLHILDFSALQSYTADDVRCVCMGANGLGDATCSVKETDTCFTTSSYSYGERLDSTTNRKRRSATRSKRWDHFKLNSKLAEAMRAETEFSTKKRRARRSQTQPKRVKREVTSLSYEEALVLCELYMNRSCPGILSLTGIDDLANITARLDNCAQDSMINDTLVEGWARVACAGAAANIEDVILKAENSLNATVVDQVISAVGCPLDCGGHGTCVNEVCDCDAGYGMDDCTFVLSGTVTIQGITGDGICNTADQSCMYIRIVTDGVVDGCECRIEHKTLDIYGNQRSRGINTVPAIFISVYEVFCPIPASNKRRRRSVSGSTMFDVADIYSISVSNDGTTFSDDSSVVSLDTTCLTLNITDNTVTLDPGYCIIDGVCYGNSTTQAGLNCSYCDVSADVFEWTIYDGQCLIDGACYIDGDTMVGDVCHFCNSSTGSTEWTDDNRASCSSNDDEDEGLAPYLIAVIVICVLLVVSAALVFFYIKTQKKKRFVGTVHAHGLFDIQKNHKFKLRPETPGKSVWEKPVEHSGLTAWIDRPKPGSSPDNLYPDCELGSVPVPTLPDGFNASPGPSTPGQSSHGPSTRDPSTSDLSPPGSVTPSESLPGSSTPGQNTWLSIPDESTTN